MSARDELIARTMDSAVQDALRCAVSIASRASEMLEGTDGALAFMALAKDINRFREESEARRAVQTFGTRTMK